MARELEIFTSDFMCFYAADRESEKLIVWRAWWVWIERGPTISLSQRALIIINYRMSSLHVIAEWTSSRSQHFSLFIIFISCLQTFVQSSWRRFLWNVQDRASRSSKCQLKARETFKSISDELCKMLKCKATECDVELNVEEKFMNFRTNSRSFRSGNDQVY